MENVLSTQFIWTQLVVFTSYIANLLLTLVRQNLQYLIDFRRCTKYTIVSTLYFKLIHVKRNTHDQWFALSI